MSLLRFRLNICDLEIVWDKPEDYKSNLHRDENVVSKKLLVKNVAKLVEIGI